MPGFPSTAVVRVGVFCCSLQDPGSWATIRRSDTVASPSEEGGGKGDTAPLPSGSAGHEPTDRESRHQARPGYPLSPVESAEHAICETKGGRSVLQTPTASSPLCR